MQSRKGSGAVVGLKWLHPGVESHIGGCGKESSV